MCKNYTDVKIIKKTKKNILSPQQHTIVFCQQDLQMQ